MFTSEQIQGYIRILIYWAAGAAVNYGMLTADKSTAIAGGIVTAVNFAWTLWGNRLVAKINELAKLGEVKNIVVSTPAVAAAAPSEKVVAQ
jgi:hypothetical protein